MTDLPRFLHDLIASPPKAGDGVHGWLFRICRQLHAHRNEDDIFWLLKAELEDCGRRVPDSEIWAAIQNSKAVAWQPHEDGKPVYVPQPAWPARDKSRIDSIVREGFGLYDLWETSPIRFDDGESHAEGIIDALFPGNPLLCVGKSAQEFATRRRETWRGKLSTFPLIVPNPMTSVKGETHEGRLSEHCLDNTGPRRFLVIEFDFSLKARDGVTDSEWASMVRAWSDAGISVADACAALLGHLSVSAPMVLAVHSGGKSVHGWFYRQGQEEINLRRFMDYAHTLGADHATWTRSQFVRIPEGLRDNGKRQTVYFWDPTAIGGEA
jgi:hypothetical protein